MDTPQNSPQAQNYDIDVIARVSARILIPISVLLITGIIAIAVFKTIGAAIPVALPVFMFGILGGFISIQRRLKSLPREDLKLMEKSWSYTLLPPFVGGALAFLLYIVFIAEIVSGTLFPTFEKLDPESNKYFSSLLEVRAQQPVQINYAKILIWSFTAGFSESFVVNIIGKIKKEA